MAQDTLFQVAEIASDFVFDDRVAAVFDNMIERSIPYYREIQTLVALFAMDYSKPGTMVYDLGCATGTTIEMLDAVLPEAVSMTGIDNSDAMIAAAKAKLASRQNKRCIQLQVGDLVAAPSFPNASVVILNWTLQFIRPPHREVLLGKICSSLLPGGCLILTEKTVSDHPTLNRLFIKHYHEYKKSKGYADEEIAKKREALENVLIPYTIQENIAILRGAGFSHVETCQQWLNFSTFIALKA